MLKRRYAIIPVLLVTAMLALPGSAGTQGPDTLERFTALQSELGFALDPHQPVDLSITLEGFRAMDLTADPFA
jgi:hypothetical protein